tara:strand:- start:328 stop:1278 length:951 start_codon:yes stop_codon:yes gene_type:complete
MHNTFKYYIQNQNIISNNSACIGDPLNHGVNGLGNQLMAVMSNALLAVTFNRCLVIQSPLLRSVFVLPNWIKSEFPDRPLLLPEGRTRIHKALQYSSVSYETRWWSHKDHFKREINSAFNTSTVEIAMHIVGKKMFSSPSKDVMKDLTFLLERHHASQWIVFHLRTFSDAKCPLGKKRYGDCGQCISTNSLNCVNALRYKTNKHALIFGDNKRAMQYVAKLGDLFEEDFFKRNTSKIVADSTAKGQTALDPAIIWNLMRLAPGRITSSTSTFSKSALLCSKRLRKNDIIVDLRCSKAHRSDGALFSCRNVKWSDLV